MTFSRNKARRKLWLNTVLILRTSALHSSLLSPSDGLRDNTKVSWILLKTSCGGWDNVKGRTRPAVPLLGHFLNNPVWDWAFSFLLSDPPSQDLDPHQAMRGTLEHSKAFYDYCDKIKTHWKRQECRTVDFAPFHSRSNTSVSFSLLWACGRETSWRNHSQSCHIKSAGWWTHRKEGLV